ncbi:MAG: hypothetical protein GY859_05845 [Desulfobacterales bacterium]|nr:hypothetical protein [Desulfobacterales bacterium]
MVGLKILEKCGDLTIFEKRRSEEDYVEIVIENDEVDQWSRLIEEFLGPPLKPAGVRPTKEINDLANRFGGVAGNQTLFHKVESDIMIVSMLWPWMDADFTTLKVIEVENRA